jgi:hypothetical protein
VGQPDLRLLHAFSEIYRTAESPDRLHRVVGNARDGIIQLGVGSDDHVEGDRPGSVFASFQQETCNRKRYPDRQSAHVQHNIGNAVELAHLGVAQGLHCPVATNHRSVIGRQYFNVDYFCCRHELTEFSSVGVSARKEVWVGVRPALPNEQRPQRAVAVLHDLRKQPRNRGAAGIESGSGDEKTNSLLGRKVLLHKIRNLPIMMRDAVLPPRKHVHDLIPA